MRSGVGLLLLVVLTSASCRRVIVPQQKLPAGQTVPADTVTALPARAASAELLTGSEPAANTGLTAKAEPAAGIDSTSSTPPATNAAPAAAAAPSELSNCIRQSAQQFLIDAHLHDRA